MKRFLPILFALILIFTLIPQAEAANADFKDVPKNHANYAEIMYLLEKGVISPQARYGVNDKVTREEVAIMVAKAVGLDGKKAKTKFKDVPESRSSSGYINSAVNAGILNGYPDGTFKPNQQVTRGHMAVFIANGFKLSQEGNTTFKDVPKGSTSYVAVRKLAHLNITSGYPDGTFKPNQSLSRAHISAFIARAMNPAFRPEVKSIEGTWVGKYTIGQRETELVLVIEDQIAYFNFNFIPTAASGKFQMSYDYNEVSNVIKLEGVKWIYNPYHYLMVNLTGSVSDNYINGAVVQFGSQIGEFTLVRK